MEGKIIILDDEAELRALLQRYLGSNGLTVRSVENVEQLDRLLAFLFGLGAGDGLPDKRNYRQQNKTTKDRN